MDNIFIIVRDTLSILSRVFHLSYNAINIIVYYIIIPMIYLIIIDLIIGGYYFTISYLFILLGAAIIIKDYNVFFDWLFEKSALFLYSFSVIRWNYYVASVIICVFVPLIVLIILLLIAI